jgi:ribonuclease HII
VQEEEWVLGSDEAGYGAYAGPLVVAAVCVRRAWRPTVKVGDSKKLTEAERETSFTGLIQDPQVVFSVVSVLPEAIDQQGLYRALLGAHTEAQANCFIAAGKPESVERIVDGVIPIDLARSLPKADQLIPACSAASIIAKVTHDREMVRLDPLHPGYGFAQHKGYGTRAHEDALDRLGVSSIHRKSFDPVARVIARAQADWMKTQMPDE